MIDFGISLFILSVITTFYVFFGGIKGVMYTDALQGVIMVCAMIFLLGFVYWLLGGVTHSKHSINRYGRIIPG